MGCWWGWSPGRLWWRLWERGLVQQMQLMRRPLSLLQEVLTPVPLSPVLQRLRLLLPCVPRARARGRGLPCPTE